jgi:hypothetical protein
LPEFSLFSVRSIPYNLLIKNSLHVFHKKQERQVWVLSHISRGISHTGPLFREGCNGRLKANKLIQVSGFFQSAMTVALPGDWIAQQIGR